MARNEPEFTVNDVLSLIEGEILETNQEKFRYIRVGNDIMVRNVDIRLNTLSQIHCKISKLKRDSDLTPKVTVTLECKGEPDPDLKDD